MVKLGNIKSKIAAYFCEMALIFILFSYNQLHSKSERLKEL